MKFTQIYITDHRKEPTTTKQDEISSEFVSNENLKTEMRQNSQSNSDMSVEEVSAIF